MVTSDCSHLVSAVKMEGKENSGGTFSKLVCEEDIVADEHPLYSNQEKQQVSMSVVRPESILNHYRLLAVSLAVLAVILLFVDIGLGVYYRKLTGDYHLITDISSELAKLQATYNTAVQSKDEAKKQLAKEIYEQQLTKWEFDHQNSRSKDYEKQKDKIQLEIATLKSHMPMLKEGCRHCFPRWTYLNSMCYYLDFSDTDLRRSWHDARQFCIKQGGDLAIIDSKEKHLVVSELITNYHTLRRGSLGGFWIGLRDVEEEGTWKWLDGRILTEGYWNDGEPNNLNDEDCAATFPRNNPFKAWNDAQCSYNLKWICEIAPRMSMN